MRDTTDQDKTQGVDDPHPLTPQQVVRERVARALAERYQDADSLFICFEGPYWREFLPEADAAIAAHYAALLEIKLPLSEARELFPDFDRPSSYHLLRHFNTIILLLASKNSHASDCAAHNAPALPVGPCDCGGTK